MLEPLAIECPYCGEGFETLFDSSEGGFGDRAVVTIEDCYVCCRPITLRHHLDASGERLSTDALRDSDG
ncbi:MAG: hypothetical protein RLZZ174_86 [Pseudomonadota bacterium]|jgi:hypothetical protein|nr:CPXCG motif-containing cysteine-rich protein [Pseudomonadales bacterium]MDA0955596.1 CPXCG motif-containing cysteine-rich protein [Pseudomonadota bacterium]